MLCFTASGRQLARMATTKPPISLSAVDLAAGAPEVGRADLTELRLITRPFPKDEGERRCYGYLVEQMRATPNHTRMKLEFERYCRRRFRVGVDSFGYCWREAIRVTGARWSQPGRRPR
jgi:hypothetical protein